MILVLDKRKLAIADAIYALRNEIGINKVTVIAVAEKVGISTQAIYKSHSEFILVINNKVDLPKAYLDALIDKEPSTPLIQEKLDLLRQQHARELDSFKKETLTSLMKNDLTLHKAKLMKNEQVNIQKQLSDRISANKQLEIELGNVKSKVIELERDISEWQLSGDININRVVILPDMRIAIEDYENSGDNKDFLLAQDFSYRQAIKNTVEEAKDRTANAIYIFL